MSAAWVLLGESRAGDLSCAFSLQAQRAPAHFSFNCAQADILRVQSAATPKSSSLLPMKIPQRLGNLDARPEQRGISP